MRLLLLHNPTAGGGNLKAPELTAAFERAGYAVDYRSTTEDEMDAIAAEAQDLVAVAGGDGTVGKVIRVLEGVDARLAIVPLGTANNIASFLEIHGAPEDVVAGLAEGRERTLDLGIAEGPWGRRVFVEGIGVGAIAGTLATGKMKDLSGNEKITFGREMLPKVLREAPTMRWRTTVDGVALPEDLLALEVLNTPVMGPRLRLAPAARPGDGRLHVAFLRPERRQAFLDWLEAGPDDHPCPMEIVHGKRATFTWTREPLHLDDKYPDPPGERAIVTVALAPAPLRVLVPKTEPAE